VGLAPAPVTGLVGELVGRVAGGEGGCALRYVGEYKCIFCDILSFSYFLTVVMG
jgi:hypothetical protein